MSDYTYHAKEDGSSEARDDEGYTLWTFPPFPPYGDLVAREAMAAYDRGVRDGEQMGRLGMQLDLQRLIGVFAPGETP